MSEHQENWTNIGRADWEGQQDSIRAAAAALDWRALPLDNVPAMPGYGIQQVIRELRLPKVSRVAWSSDLAPCGFYGIEANYRNGRAQVFILDKGSELTPLVSYFWPAAPALEGAKA